MDSSGSPRKVPFAIRRRTSDQRPMPTPVTAGTSKRHASQQRISLLGFSFRWSLVRFLVGSAVLFFAIYLLGMAYFVGSWSDSKSTAPSEFVKKPVDLHQLEAKFHALNLSDLSPEVATMLNDMKRKLYEQREIINYLEHHGGQLPASEDGFVQPPELSNHSQVNPEFIDIGEPKKEAIKIERLKDNEEPPHLEGNAGSPVTSNPKVATASLPSSSDSSPSPSSSPSETETKGNKVDHSYDEPPRRPRPNGPDTEYDPRQEPSEELLDNGRPKKRAHRYKIDEKDNTPIYIWRTVPSSSVWCEGSNRAERVCKFRNLCYAPQYERWFIFKTNRTVLHGVPENHHTTALLEMTTVTSHTAIFFNYEEVNPFSPKFRNIPIRYEEDLHFITMRLHPENIMHNLHDDTLGLYFLIKQYVGQGSAALDMPFSLDTHRILVDDGFLATNTEQPLRYLSSRPIRYRNYLDQEPDVITCFRDAVVGNRKLVNWYQYGFTEPQGPIKDKHVNGMHIREISEWYARRMKLPLDPEEDYQQMLSISEAREKLEEKKRQELTLKREIEEKRLQELEEQRRAANLSVEASGNATDSDTTSSALPPVPTSFHPGTLIPGVPENYDPTLDPNMDPISTDIIVILSRRGNRLIVNEDDLAERLHERYGLEVVFVRNEDHGFEEQVAFMRRARVVLGMHGSLLIMGMFCKRGAIMIELFPYGVPSENYTPYRTMAHLPGMLVSYRAWENKHKNNTISHPDRHALFGGIKHLSEEEQREIEESTTIPPHKCCTNPRWLYRIYADTIVEINEVIGLIDDAVKESRLMRFNNYLRNWEEPDMLELPTVETPVCLDGPGRKPGELWARWGNPFSGAKVDRWSVMVEEKQTEYMAIYGPLVAISGFEPGTEVVFWVRPTYPDGRNGEFGNRGKCPV